MSDISQQVAYCTREHSCAHLVTNYVNDIKFISPAKGLFIFSLLDALKRPVYRGIQAHQIARLPF